MSKATRAKANATITEETDFITVLLVELELLEAVGPDGTGLDPELGRVEAPDGAGTEEGTGVTGTGTVATVGAVAPK